jgi:hypothetical protein
LRGDAVLAAEALLLLRPRLKTHRLYIRKGLRISAHHFSIDISSSPSVLCVYE